MSSVAYRVITTTTGSLKIAPIGATIPEGWAATEVTGSISVCMAHIATQRRLPLVPSASEHEGVLPMLPAQRWFFEQAWSDDRLWLEYALFVPSEPLRVEPLRQAARLLVERHQALRAAFVQSDAGWEQRVLPASQVELLTCLKWPAEGLTDLAGLTEAVLAQVSAEMCLGVPPLLRLILVQSSGGVGQVLLLVGHRLVADPFSRLIILDELQRAYAQLWAGQQPALLPGTTIQDWVSETRRAAGKVQGELDYWNSLPWEELQPPLAAQRGKQVARGTFGARAELRVPLGPELTTAIVAMLPARSGVHIQDILLSGVAAGVTYWGRREVVQIAALSHGRGGELAPLNLVRTVGWFASYYPVVLDLRAAHSPDAILSTVRAQLQRIPSGGMGYNTLRYGEAAPPVRLVGVPDADVYFCYWSQQRASAPSPGDVLMPSGLPGGAWAPPETPLPWGLYCSVGYHDGSLVLSIEYSSTQYDSAAVQGLADQITAFYRQVASRL